MPARRAQSKAAKPPFDVDALWAVKRLGTPTLSPDGSLACAAVTSYAMDRNAGTTELWLYPTGAGGAARPGAAEARGVSPPGDKDSNPRWSPDGTRIAFIAKRKDDASRRST